MKACERFAIVAGMILLATAAFCGCRHVSVRTSGWQASYWQVLQTTEAEGLEVQAGENILLKIDKVRGEIDPKVRAAAANAAALLMEAAN